MSTKPPVARCWLLTRLVHAWPSREPLRSADLVERAFTRKSSASFYEEHAGRPAPRVVAEVARSMDSTSAHRLHVGITYGAELGDRRKTLPGSQFRIATISGTAPSSWPSSGRRAYVGSTRSRASVRRPRASICSYERIDEPSITSAAYRSSRSYGMSAHRLLARAAT